MGSWLSGPRSVQESPPYRGERLGLAPDGRGSVAGFGRRLAALAIDWAVAILVSRVVFTEFAYGSNDFSLVVMAVFFLEVTVLTWLSTASFGQRIVGIGVVRLAGGRLGLPRTALRTALLCLVVPAVVMDRDGRGLHDRAAGSVVVRMR